MSDEMIYTMKIDGEVDIRGEVISCPECGQKLDLTLSAFPADSEVSTRCSQGHVWAIPDVPGTFVRTLYFEALCDPYRTIHVDGSGW